MTTLTPFRLFQICKYALNQYTSTLPLLNRTRKRLKNQVDEIKRNRKRNLVGFHVEERRGWDTKPIDATTCATESRPVDADTAFPLRIPLDAADRRVSPSPSPVGDGRPPPPPVDKRSEISRLLSVPLVPPHFTAPRNVIVLCHGLYGFSTATPIPLFPSLKLHYWHSVLQVLRHDLGCKVMVVGVKGTGSIEERAGQMHAWLKEKLPPGTGVNFMAHSMGGLDCRYLISHIKPTTYKPISLTMIGTPNRGSPFMDWCAANIGVGVPSMTKAAIKAAASGALPPYSLKSPILSRTLQDGLAGKSPQQRDEKVRQDTDEAVRTASTSSSTSLLAIPQMFGSSITNYLLGLLDHPAYGNLTTHFLSETFNPSTPDDPNVKYLSVAGRINKMSVLHPLWFPKLILDAAAEKGYAEEKGRSGKNYEGNDGLVSVSSAKWGEWLGTVDKCHHWDLRGEGGLLPDLPTNDERPEGRPDPNHPDGWDWHWKNDHMEKKGEKKVEKKGEAWLNEEALAKMPEMLQKASVSTGAAGWDMKQVGEVIDWVSDHIPGTGTGTQGSEEQDIGHKQLRDAATEKASEGTSGKDRLAQSMANEAGMRQTGEKGKRVEKAGGVDEFDLGRFYGGLAHKLREEGF